MDPKVHQTTIVYCICMRNNSAKFQGCSFAQNSAPWTFGLWPLFNKVKFFMTSKGPEIDFVL